MRSLSVVPEQPLDEFAVENIRIQKFGLVVINKLLLDGAVEPLVVGVHLWGPGIGMPVGLVETSEFLVEVLHELAAIVGEHVFETMGEEQGDEIKELLCRERGMASRRPGEGEAGIDVREGNHISPERRGRTARPYQRRRNGRECVATKFLGFLAFLTLFRGTS